MRMKVFPLNISPREGIGRGPSRRLRYSEKIPAVLYGETGTRHLTLDRAEFRRLWKQVAGRTALVELDSGSAKELSVIKEVQRDPRSDRFLHIDFREVQRDREMAIKVVLHFTGEAFGVKNEGGTLEVRLHSLGIRCLPKDLPEFFEVDVSALKVGDNIHVSDLKPPAGVTFTAAKDIVVVSCVAKAAEEVKAEEAVVPVEGAEAVPAGEAGKAAPAAEGGKTAAPAAEGGKAAPAAGKAPAKAKG